MKGKGEAEARAELVKSGITGETLEKIIPRKVCSCDYDKALKRVEQYFEIYTVWKICRHWQIPFL